MSKVIIGIHGLGNKPPEPLLGSWWRLAIEEGLKAIAKPHYFFKFQLAYWSRFLHQQPLDPQLKDPEDPLYIPDPYLPGNTTTPDKAPTLRQKMLGVFKKQMSHILLDTDFTIRHSQISNMVIHYFYKDLDIYYSANCPDAEHVHLAARECIQTQLMSILREHRKKDIMIIAHSMGTIIAYDVLKQLEGELVIDTLVTLGSPLGLSTIQRRLHPATQSGNKNKFNLITPQNIRRFWFNFADPEDKVAMDYQLAEDFAENRYGVKPLDFLVHNNYELHGERNPHKIYGYLRAKQVAETIDNFLTSERFKVSIWFGDKINRIWGEKKVKYESR
jgi:hypothetical protein